MHACDKLLPDAVQCVGAKDDVYDGVGDTVEWREALNEHRHGVLVLTTGRRQQTVCVEQIEHEIRTPAEYERCESTTIRHAVQALYTL